MCVLREGREVGDFGTIKQLEEKETLLCLALASLEFHEGRKDIQRTCLFEKLVLEKKKKKKRDGRVSPKPR